MSLALAAAGCSHEPDEPTAYDPEAGGWTLYAALDFDSSISAPLIPTFIDGEGTVGEPDGIGDGFTYGIEDGQFVYVGDTDYTWIWIDTGSGVVSADFDYKVYVELHSSLSVGDKHVLYHMYRHDLDGAIEAQWWSDTRMLLAVWDEVLGSRNDLPSSWVSPGVAYELLVEGLTATVRVVELDSGTVLGQVSATIATENYRDENGIRLRCGGSGVIRLDNYTIYTRPRG